MVFNTTFRARLHDAERHWLAKFCMRVSTIIAALVAIGCIAWASSPFNQTFSYYFYLIPWEFIPLGISVLWNITNIAVLLIRKKPMHPGANVGLDLVLWMALIVTAVFATIAAVYELQGAFYYDNYDGGSYGDVLLPNGTYVYEYGYYTISLNDTEVFVPGNSSCPGFASCAEQTQLDSQHRKLGVIELVGSVFSYIVVLFHFALFVWACVDTNRRENGKVDARAHKIAQAIVADMETRGFLPTQQMTQQEEPLLVRQSNSGLASEAPVVLPSLASTDAEPASRTHPTEPAQIPLPHTPPTRSSQDPDVITTAPLRHP